ncbi:AbrB/MazE/SpoVT family DNA-binding domain-containing protein [Candidatus Bathyarchaeota archaeon]|nr:MAG: AbrB/MazE/SpoVT family DNA-binding domain-containing protein [Candidatus Bathyarchaeota archaeon]
MKLQKQAAYKLEGNRVQFKYVVTIPEQIVEELDWEEGSELNASIKGKNLLIERVSAPVGQISRVRSSKMSYEQFRDKIKGALEYNDQGMTWTKLRGQLQLNQVVPNNKWVRRLERDIRLMRLKGSDGVVLWRVNHAR